jgi:Asp-tRNA(Asn)/Glu-tRNA(Gln) amidotransferase C subunit
MGFKDKKETKAEQLETLKDVLRKWQKIEDGSVEHTTAILEKTQNPIIRLIMEIIRQDSVMHKKVQQAILDSLERESFQLQPEELADIWDLIEEHDEAEEEAIRMAEQARRNCPLVIQRQLLEYLIDDERKHERLMGHLEDFKRSLYPYA